VLGSRLVFDGLVRRYAGGDQGHAVESELKVRLLGADQVTKMWRIERAAEDAYAHGPLVPRPGHARTCPVPSIRYLNVHSSRNPIGPRAWSFWVELPISAPIPNSPPSVNRVDALTYTHAASTPSWKALAAAVSCVTIASEWPLPCWLMCSIASALAST